MSKKVKVNFMFQCSNVQNVLRNCVVLPVNIVKVTVL